MAENIVRLLEQRSTREALTKSWEYIVFCAQAILNETAGVSEAEAIQTAWYNNGYPPFDALRVMRELVLEKSPRPHIISAVELADSLFSLMPQHGTGWMDDDVFQNVYPAFLNRVRTLVSARSSRPFAISLMPDEYDPSVDRVELWTGHGIAIQARGIGRADIDAEFESKLPMNSLWRDLPLVYAEFHGYMSEIAVTQLHAELPGVIRSLVRSISIAAPPRELDDPPDGGCLGLAMADFALLNHESTFIRVCLDGYFAKPQSKKDSLDRRTRNAVTLLVEADAQLNHAVGIGLSVTAIEALLGKGDQAINKTVSERVAILLEPKPGDRVVAERFMEKVYNDRSRALHGQELEATRERREQIRLLAAGTLYGFVNYREFLRRGGFNPQSPDEMMEQLRQLKYEAGQPPGVPELPRVCKLWRSGSR